MTLTSSEHYQSRTAAFQEFLKGTDTPRTRKFGKVVLEINRFETLFGGHLGGNEVVV